MVGQFKFKAIIENLRKKQAIFFDRSQSMGLYPHDGSVYIGVQKVESGQRKLILSDKVCSSFLQGGDENLRVFVREKKLQRVPATLVLPKDEYEIIMMDNFLQDISEKHSTLKWRMGEYLDYPCEKAVVDYISLPSKSKVNGKIYALAAREDMIQGCKEWARRCNINLQKIDVWQNAIKQVIEKEKHEKGCLIIQMGMDKSEVVIIRNNQIYFIRELDIALKDIKYINDATAIYENLTLEIQRTIDYCSSNIRNPGITQILVGMDGPDALDMKLLEKNLGFPVSPLVFPDLISSKHMNTCDLISGAAAMGSAI